MQLWLTPTSRARDPRHGEGTVKPPPATMLRHDKDAASQGKLPTGRGLDKRCKNAKALKAAAAAAATAAASKSPAPAEQQGGSTPKTEPSQRHNWRVLHGKPTAKLAVL